MVGRLACGMPATTNSTPVSISPEMKWTLRASRPSLAMTSVAFCRRLSSMALSSSGRLVWRLPDSNLGELGQQRSGAPPISKNRLTASHCAASPSPLSPWRSVETR